MKCLLQKKDNKDKRLAALIDGEHYPEVSRDAINLLKTYFPGSFSGIIFLNTTWIIPGNFARIPSLIILRLIKLKLTFSATPPIASMQHQKSCDGGCETAFSS